jgi:hypothetical protein
VRAVIAVVVMMEVPRGTDEMFFDNDRGRRHMLDHNRTWYGGRRQHRCGNSPDRWVLHGADNFASNSLLSQKDDITRLQWRSHAVRPDVIYDQIGRYTGACHLYDVVRVDRSDWRLHIVGGHLLGDLRLIAGLDVIQGASHQTATNCAGSGANQRAGAGMSDGVPHERSNTRPAQTAQ